MMAGSPDSSVLIIFLSGLPGRIFVSERALRARLVLHLRINELDPPFHASFQIETTPSNVLSAGLLLILIVGCLQQDILRYTVLSSLIGLLMIGNPVRHPRLRITTGQISVFSVTFFLRIVSILSWSCLSTSLSSRLRSFCMTTGATFTVLFSIAMLFMPRLVVW